MTNPQTPPLPRRPAPPLSFPLTTGETWRLDEQAPERFTLIVFYRGVHCPVCKKYLEELTRMQSRFADRGTEVVAVSMDNEARARKTRQDWDIDGLKLGYALPVEQAQAWGLYLSEAVKEQEPSLFSEPGLFLVRPDGTLYMAVINSMPFGRPRLADVLKSIEYVIENDYPARGEVAEPALEDFPA